MLIPWIKELHGRKKGLTAVTGYHTAFGPVTIRPMPDLGFFTHHNS